MCVILIKPPKVIIPAEKIVAATRVNPDGWGFSALEKKGNSSVLTTHTYADGRNKAKEVIDCLEKYHDNLVFMHLRFNTRGKTSVDNCHPFHISYNKESNVQYMFMHNGTIAQTTLSKFTEEPTTEKSDSRVWAEEVMRPLFDRTLQFGIDPIGDSLVEGVMETGAGGAGVFVVYDSTGDYNIYGNQGVEFTEESGTWWASNKYSFNPSHRDNDYNTNKATKKYTQGFAIGDYTADWPPNPSTSNKTNFHTVKDSYHKKIDVKELWRYSDWQLENLCRNSAKEAAELMKELMGTIDELWEEYLDYLEEKEEDDEKDTTSTTTSTLSETATTSTAATEASFTETKALPAPKSLKVTPAPAKGKKKGH